jgi:prenyltransferase beta subunit
MVLFLLLISCRHLDVPLLVAWLSARQHAPEGGFAGRTNKLVDGCYSHWVGGVGLAGSSIERSTIC